jgi:uncharacterized integral membrane protein
MNKSSYITYSGYVFAVVFVIHVVRIINQWDFVFGAWDAPMLLSWIAAATTGTFAYHAWVFSKK